MPPPPGCGKELARGRKGGGAARGSLLGPCEEQRVPAAHLRWEAEEEAVRRARPRSSAGPRSAAMARPRHPMKSWKGFHPCGRIPSSGVMVRLLALFSKRVDDAKAPGGSPVGYTCVTCSMSRPKFGRKVANGSCMTHWLLW